MQVKQEWLTFQILNYHPKKIITPYRLTLHLNVNMSNRNKKYSNQ